ncbi:hypothetical protein N657DRAFT_648468 [Parathielavia appendiculata]|uniref:Uncharacterized protein n=1 Tax=Parathielavia appendiculata TaxID=2587402 RepID=A0AAN6TWA6_9PEZI|nr:hypothetical protein N657DRAFT_648468 [Parathielavia appendiculata]
MAQRHPQIRLLGIPVSHDEPALGVKDTRSAKKPFLLYSLTSSKSMRSSATQWHRQHIQNDAVADESVSSAKPPRDPSSEQNPVLAVLYSIFGRRVSAVGTWECWSRCVDSIRIKNLGRCGLSSSALQTWNLACRVDNVLAFHLSCRMWRGGTSMPALLPRGSRSLTAGGADRDVERHGLPAATRPVLQLVGSLTAS